MSFEDPNLENVVSESPKDNFERQFAKREYFEVAGGTAEVVDVSPEKIKDEVPVFLAPAWACDLGLYKSAMETLVNKDRRVVSLEHPRRGGDLEAGSKEQSPEELLKKYPTEELRKALNILSVMEQKHIEKADFFAHSEGAINTTIAAMLHPEKFRNIIFFAPAGLIGEDTFTRLIQGFMGQSKRPESIADMPITDKEKEDGKAAMQSVLKSLTTNPLRGLKEAVEISKSQIHEMIRYLHDKGIGIVVMSAVDDPVFPMREMKKIAKTDMIDGFLSTRGGHGAMDEHIVWADKMLTALEGQRQKGVTASGQKHDLSEEFI